MSYSDFSPNCKRADEVPVAYALHTSSKEVSVYVQAAYDGCGGAASAGRADGSRYGL